MRIEFNPAAADDCQDIVIAEATVKQLLQNEIECHQAVEINKARGRWRADVVLDDGRKLRIEFVRRDTAAIRVQAVEVTLGEV